jgi:tryptophanyl-tRNA synthetase
MEIRYGDMKKQMAADANKLLAPIREKIIAFSSDDALLDKIMRQGAEAASARAEKTIEEVREIIGFRKV